MENSHACIGAAAPKTAAGPAPCDLCGATDYKRVAEENGHAIYRCRGCGLVQVRPLPAETKEVNQRYWHVDLDDPAVRVSRAGSRPVFLHGLQCLQRLTGESIRGKKVLDVGCGMGLFLEIVQEQEGVPYGLDLTPEAVQFTRELCKIDTVAQGYFETCDLPPGFFDVITGWGILHHTRSPSQWFAQAYRLLADGGILLVKMPNVSFTSAAYRLTPLLRALGLPATHYLASRPPLNLYGFTRETLAALLEKASFEVLTVESARIRGNAGFLGGLTSAATALATGLTAGKIDFHPGILAIARKRGKPGAPSGSKTP